MCKRLPEGKLTILLQSSATLALTATGSQLLLKPLDSRSELQQQWKWLSTGGSTLVALQVMAGWSGQLQLASSTLQLSATAGGLQLVDGSRGSLWHLSASGALQTIESSQRVVTAAGYIKSGVGLLSSLASETRRPLQWLLAPQGCVCS